MTSPHSRRERQRGGFAAAGIRSPELAMSTVDAAAILGITPATLRQWTEQHGFPTSRSHRGRRAFNPSEILALKHALSSEHSVIAAIEIARRENRCLPRAI